MLIQLRQNEIEEAVKMYVAAQGINLYGKKVDMNFTAGRGSAGITVDLDIVDAKLSDLAQPVARAAFQPALVQGEFTPAAAPAPAEARAATAPAPAAAEPEMPWNAAESVGQAEESQPAEEEAVAQPAPSASLFG